MIMNLISHFAASCPGGGFLGFPTWYAYLPGTTDPITHLCTPQVASLTDVWLIVVAVIDILLRIAALVAVGFVMYGGFNYVTSQGESEKTAKARSTIISALAGLVIAVMASVVIGFIAGSIK